MDASDEAMAACFHGHPKPFNTSHGKTTSDVMTAAERKAIRKHKSKMNQRRYRADQKLRRKNLEASVQALNIEIAHLEGRVDSMRQLVPAPLHSFEPETKIVHHYFKMFANGLRKNLVNPNQSLQLEFLSSIMVPDLVFLESIGIDKLSQQWQLYSTSFHSFQVECHGFKPISFSPNIIISVDTTVHLRLSRQSFCLLFPHILHNEQLTQKMVGRVLSVPTQQIFFFKARNDSQSTGGSLKTLGKS
ncbi:hypothetical protein AC1031_000950 [Aphanomyces cochlioides]|nr:hypothetical protein AC1031_000950 [Aphanomyces cochlioides]